MKYLIHTGTLLSLIAALSCNRDSFITDSSANLSVSTDSMYFDTVFTSVGSVTSAFKIYNRNDRKLLLNTIKLSGGNSYFRINADGVAGPEVNNVEVEANDSIYVFVTVQIEPDSKDLPFIVEDSISIAYNGKATQVKLSAWGQNAHFLRSAVINANTTWNNEKPYVIIGGVSVAESAKLTIEKGTRIYLHADAPILVGGTLEAVGETYDSTKIVFQSDRLEQGYRDYPGSWPGIYFGSQSHDNLLSNVIIKNAYQGIVAEDPSTNSAPKLLLEQTVIDNCYDAGIIGSSSDIKAVNCLVSNCGKNLLLVNGGNYNFTHCTVVSLSNSFIQHTQPVCTITDFIKQGDNLVGHALNATLTNCIFWGANGIIEDEVVVLKETSEPFLVSFSNCIWKNVTMPENTVATSMIGNQDPLFVDPDNEARQYDFRLSEGSPAIGAGKAAGIGDDLDGIPRDPAAPDIGAYESAF